MSLIHDSLKRAEQQRNTGSGLLPAGQTAEQRPHSPDRSRWPWLVAGAFLLSSGIWVGTSMRSLPDATQSVPEETGMTAQAGAIPADTGIPAADVAIAEHRNSIPAAEKPLHNTVLVQEPEMAAAAPMPAPDTSVAGMPMEQPAPVQEQEKPALPRPAANRPIARTEPESAPVRAEPEKAKGVRELYADWQGALARDDFASALSALSGIQRILPPDHLMRLRMEAWTAYRQERFVLAANYYHRILQRLPGEVDAAISLAASYQKLGQLDQARATIAEALKHSPRSEALRQAQRRIGS